MHVQWDWPVSALRGVGDKRAAHLAKIGIRTVGDLLTHCPLRYEDRRTTQALGELVDGQTACVEVQVCGPGKIVRRGRRRIVTVPATDGTQTVTLVWFNQPYRATQFPRGSRLLVTGRSQLRGRSPSIVVSEVERLDNNEHLSARRLTAVYPLTAGLSQRLVRGLVSQALERIERIPPGVVPATTLKRRGLMTFEQAVRMLHLPASLHDAQQARRRLAYEELYLLQACLARYRSSIKSSADGIRIPAGRAAKELAGVLPFTLTAAQERVIAGILDYLASAEPAYCLVHGDVGSGKTVVAAAALLATARAGHQAAIMVPTELLAEQHHERLSRMLQPLGVRVALLTGGLPRAAAAEVKRDLQAGCINVVVGTHALLQSNVTFADLALVIVDEQHRFGVRQRAALCSKGRQPHVIVMSATPIPRTLALTAYGDFDILVLDELPPGRKPVYTKLLLPCDRRRAYDFIIRRVQEGQQGYIVCPLIKEAASQYLVAAESYYHHLAQQELPDLRLGLVHGAMAADRRRQVVAQFRRGEVDVLVATSVLEVGVDVPSATVMMVENAERFGLAQLHQLRGRVARSRRQAYCLLVSGSDNPQVIDRLQVLVRCNDGFEIAREDLRRRGPGEITGVRQHGLPNLRIADLLADTRTLAQARRDAFAAVAEDPALQLPQHAALRHALQRYSLQQWAL